MIFEQPYLRDHPGALPFADPRRRCHPELVLDHGLNRFDFEVGVLTGHGLFDVVALLFAVHVAFVEVVLGYYPVGLEGRKPGYQ